MAELTLHDLTVRDGVLMRLRSATPHLTTPPISIEGKKGINEIAANDVIYYFNLNDAPDDIWQGLFSRLLEGVSARIREAQLEIQCGPTNLTGRYTRVKETIAKTNDAYSAYKRDLIARVADLDELRRKESEAAAAHTKVVSEQFENLPL